MSLQIVISCRQMYPLYRRTTRHTVMAKGRRPLMSRSFETVESPHKAKLRPTCKLGTPISVLGVHTVFEEEPETAHTD